MNNFPFNNVNLLQNLAMIRANLIAQNGLGANPLLNPAPQNTFIPMNQPFVPFQANQGEAQNSQTPQNPLQNQTRKPADFKISSKQLKNARNN